jgi:hypothetical protein
LRRDFSQNAFMEKSLNSSECFDEQLGVAEARS